MVNELSKAPFSWKSYARSENREGTQSEFNLKFQVSFQAKVSRKVEPPKNWILVCKMFYF